MLKKYKTYSTKVLQKMAKVKTGEELEVIKSILESRGASQEHPSGGTLYNGTETPEYKAEMGITPEDEKKLEEADKAAEAAKEAAKEDKPKAKKEKAPKAEKAPRELKKTRSLEEAKVQLEEAKKNVGHFITVKTFRGGEEVTGTITGVRLDPRSNFVQYRIRLEDGKMIGKGVDNPDVVVGEVAPKPAKKEKSEPAPAEAPEAPEAPAEATAPEEASED